LNIQGEQQGWRRKYVEKGGKGPPEKGWKRQRSPFLRSLGGRGLGKEKKKKKKTPKTQKKTPTEGKTVIVERTIWATLHGPLNIEKER